MSFSYQPKTANEIAAQSLLPDGEYPFDISKASDAPSKSTGKAMLTLTLEVYPGGVDSKTKTVTDRIVMGNAYADKKLFELCRALGLSEKYQSGTLNAVDFESRSGWAKIGFEKGKEKPDGSGNWPDKNRVNWYLKEAPGIKPVEKPQPTERELANLPPNGAIEEDVPF